MRGEGLVHIDNVRYVIYKENTILRIESKKQVIHGKSGCSTAVDNEKTSW